MPAHSQFPRPGTLQTLGLCVVICVALRLTALAQTTASSFFPVLTTAAGLSFTNATISGVTTASATVKYDGGIAIVRLGDLPGPIQKQYHYDSVKEASEQKKQSEASAKWVAGEQARKKALRATDWPEWRGPNRNGSGASAEALAGSWPSGGPRRIWLADRLPSGGGSSPVVANGRVYVYIHHWRAKLDTVVCLDEITGAKEWQMDFPVEMTTLHEASGTPCISGGRCFVMGARVSYCLDAASGAVIWKQDSRLSSKERGSHGPSQEVSSSFAIVGGVAVVICGPPLGYDPQTGALLWKGSAGGGWSDISSSVSICPGDRIVYSGEHRFACLEAKTGKVVWELPGGGKHLCHYGVTPVVSGNVLLATSREELRGYDLCSERPRELWHVPYGEEYSTPAADAERVFMVDTGLNTNSTGKAWAEMSALHGAYQVVCRKLKTGEVLWHTPIPDSQYTSPILVDGKVFILTDNPSYLQMLDSRDGRLLGSIAVGAVRWSTPAIAHGKIFLRVKNGVACYDLTAPRLDTARWIESR